MVAKAPGQFFAGLTFVWAAFDDEKATARGRRMGKKCWSADVQISNFEIWVYFCELRVRGRKNQNGTASTRPSPSWWGCAGGGCEGYPDGSRSIVRKIDVRNVLFGPHLTTRKRRREAENWTKSADQRTLRNQISKSRGAAKDVGYVERSRSRR